MMSVATRIQSEIDTHPVVLFMKGTAEFPMCGFSATVTKILQHLDVTFRDLDVLQDQELREGIKAFSDWPTIPQLYIRGEFVGGCDIVRDLFQTGELMTLLADKAIPFSVPKVEAQS